MKDTSNAAGRNTRAILAACAAWLACALPASAHPHVWVTYETTVIYGNGTITGVGHVWTFDDMYAAMAIQGLDANGDGNYDRQELTELAQTNIDGLKTFQYFTFAKLAGANLAFSDPQDAWLEYTNGILRLHFRLPLAQPVLAEAQGFGYSIYDPSFFIAFEPEKTDAVKLSSAPAGCTAALVDDGGSQPSNDAAQQLGAAMAQQLGDPAAVSAYGGATKTVSVTCKKS